MKDTRLKVLIGYDGSDCSIAALADLRRAGLPREAEATIITVSELWLPPPSGRPLIAAAISTSGLNSISVRSGPGAAAVTEAGAEALKAKSSLQKYFPAWEIVAEEAQGSPARQILKRADQLKADLIVVGSQGHSKLGRFVLGSVSQKVANEAHCSVRVARGTAWKNGGPVRILLGLDGSTAADAAVHVVATRVWPTASEVRLVTIVDRLPSTAQSSSAQSKAVLNGSENAPKWVEEFVGPAARKLRAAGLAVSCQIEVGDPKHLLIADAEEWGAECIFIGASCTEAAPEKSLLGSVATAVLTRACCSVEVVRAGSDLLV